MSEDLLNVHLADAGRQQVGGAAVPQVMRSTDTVEAGNPQRLLEVVLSHALRRRNTRRLCEHEVLIHVGFAQRSTLEHLAILLGA